MCTQYVHLGSNTLCNLTKKCIRAYAQKAAELKPTLQRQILLNIIRKIKKKKIFWYFLSKQIYLDGLYLLKVS